MGGCSTLGGIFLLATFSFVLKGLNVWNDVFEFPEVCDHPPLPANTTGVRVMVAGLFKTGTKTMSRSLNEIGLRTYHSEDFSFWPMWDWAVQEWARRGPTNATFFKWDSFGAMIHSYPHRLGGETLGGETLAQAVSKCRVDALAFDGLELFYAPLLKLSPDVKVIHLNWRSYAEWQSSQEAFLPMLAITCLKCMYETASLAALPWAGLLRLLDPLLGSPISSTIREGGPAVTHISPPLMYVYHQLVHPRRLWPAWFVEPVTFAFPSNEEQYAQVAKDVQASVPPERLLSWDPRKGTFEELCAFVGVSPCPRSGRLPRPNNVFPMERDFPVTGFLVCAVCIFFHWVNWRLVCGLCAFCCRLRASHEKKDQ